MIRLYCLTSRKVMADAGKSNLSYWIMGSTALVDSLGYVEGRQQPLAQSKLWSFK